MTKHDQFLVLHLEFYIYLHRLNLASTTDLLSSLKCCHFRHCENCTAFIGETTIIQFILNYLDLKRKLFHFYTGKLDLYQIRRKSEVKLPPYDGNRGQSPQDSDIPISNTFSVRYDDILITVGGNTRVTA